MENKDTLAETLKRLKDIVERHVDFSNRLDQLEKEFSQNDKDLTNFIVPANQEEIKKWLDYLEERADFFDRLIKKIVNEQ
ncbi:hypothetical protein KAU34_09095 [candidate division WOR-3 bacterium]|nr:hypothetical protein [candidate division WOR-3 bacterium]